MFVSYAILGTPHLSLQAQSYREPDRAVEGARRRDSERESELSKVSPEFRIVHLVHRFFAAAHTERTVPFLVKEKGAADSAAP
jgi:hypothetical protein